MFPGYVFAQFVYAERHRAVEYSAGVHYIVHFGQQVATLPPEAIAALSEKAGEDEIVTIDSEIEVGQAVQIVEGPLHGFDALVTQVLPAKERVRVLLDFLGRSVETELSAPRVLSAEKPRLN
jgi:transcriptional antiterminator RfaH